MEDDQASQDWLVDLEKSLSDIQEESATMTAHWEAERAKRADANGVKEKLEKAKAELDIAKREGNLAKAGELSYGVIPQLEKQLENAEPTESASDDAVRAEHIAQVIERWTGIPTMMLEGEREYYFVWKMNS